MQTAQGMGSMCGSSIASPDGALACVFSGDRVTEAAGR
jgi:hypothetical protein